MNKLSIIVVNWNSGQQLKDCVVSILNSQQNNFVLNEVIVVDNASTDNSLELLPKSSQVKIIRNNENYGFGRACNIGAHIAIKADLLLFLNPDTKLNINTLDAAIKYYYDNHKSIDFKILGIKLFHNDGTVQRSCARFPTLTSYLFDSTGLSKFYPSKSLHMDDFDHNVSRVVDHVIGAFFLMDVSIFQKLGGFDEDYFVYLEDLDFSYRAKQYGYNSYFLADVSAMHVGGGCSQQVKAHRLFYSLNSRLIYTKKHFSTLDNLLVCVLTLVIEPFTRVIFSLLKRDLQGVKETMLGYNMLYKKKFF